MGNYIEKTVISIFKHNPTDYTHSHCSSGPVYLWGCGYTIAFRVRFCKTTQIYDCCDGRWNKWIICKYL